MTQVLDHGFVELIDIEGNDAQLASRARISRNSKYRSVDHDARLIAHLVKSGHHSIFEFTSMTFKVKAPQMVMQQWTRHRIGVSFNVMSGRHVQFTDVYAPDADWPFDLQTYYAYCFTLYREALVAGVPLEKARAVLPGFVVYYTFVVQFNLRALMHWLDLRMASPAQWEHRQYAEAVLPFFCDAFPATALAWAKSEEAE